MNPASSNSTAMEDETFHENFSNPYDNSTDFYAGDLTLEEYLEYINPRSWTWGLIALHCTVFFVGLIGNCLVCVAVYRNHSMRTVTNYFIVNLAVADALVLVFCLPFSVIWDVTETWWFGTALCKIVLYLQSVSVTVSILTLAFISIDRWYAICFPLKFKSTTGRAKTAIAIIWVISMIFDIPEPIFLVAKPYHESTIYLTQCVPTWSDQTERVFMMLKMGMFYVVPLVFISAAYVQIIRVLWRSGAAPHRAPDMTVRATGPGTPLTPSGRCATGTFAMNTNTSTEGQLRSRRKAAKMLVAVVVMFAICFLPVHLLSVLRVCVKLSNSETNKAMSLLSHWLCYANSAVNPIIYNFMSGKFRREFRQAFAQCCQRSDGKSRGFQRCDTFSRKTQDGTSTRVSLYDNHQMKTFKEHRRRLSRKPTRTSVVNIEM